MCAEVSFHTLGIKLRLSFWWQLSHLPGLPGVGLEYGLHSLSLPRTGMTASAATALPPRFCELVSNLNTEYHCKLFIKTQSNGQ